MGIRSRVVLRDNDRTYGEVFNSRSRAMGIHRRSGPWASIADRGHESRRHDHVQARHRHPPLDPKIGKPVLSEVPLDQLQILPEAVDLTDVTLDRPPVWSKN